MMHLREIERAVHGELIGANALVDGVTIDSRAEVLNKLFIALKGDRFDGHDYAAQVIDSGAAGVLVEQADCDVEPRIKVSDSHLALKQLAGWWRDKFDIPLIGITGSVGKTTVKEMVGSVCRQAGETLITAGNFNNEIGLPLTLLRLTKDHEFAVIEMGMNHAGEISRLTQIAKPSIALINNAGAAHLEGLGSVEAVAKAKGEIFECLAEDGVAIINADDPFAGLWRELAGDRKIISFGVDNAADITATFDLSTEAISINASISNHGVTHALSLDLPLQGKHSVLNVLATIAVAIAANISIEDIKQGLTLHKAAAGRLKTQTIGSISLIDDTYNANPVSTHASMQVLAAYPESTLIVGDMAELGESSQVEHERLGELANKLNIDRIYAVGRFASHVVRRFNGTQKAFANQSELIDFLKENAPTSGAVLVKGSRSAHMENIVSTLTNYYGQESVVSANDCRGEI